MPADLRQYEVIARTLAYRRREDASKREIERAAQAVGSIYLFLLRRLGHGGDIVAQGVVYGGTCQDGPVGGLLCRVTEGGLVRLITRQRVRGARRGIG